MIQDSTEQINYSLSNTPWYYGAYLNMARHNIFLLINHLTERFPHLKFKPIKNDSEINTDNILTSIFDTSNKALDIDRIRVYKYLLRRHHLPFIRIFHDDDSGSRPTDTTPIVNFQQLHLFINDTFQRLVSLRDSFSHYLALDENFEPIKSRDLEVSEIIKRGINGLFYRSPEFSFQRFAIKQEEKDYEHLEFYKLFQDDHKTLSEHGLYFFINLFLERKQAIKFLKKIKGFKNETIPAFRATIQAFTNYSLKVPDIKLDNDDQQMSILMEMINELQKCPVILYNHLSQEDQELFHPELATESRNNILLASTNYEELEDKDIDSLLSELSTLKRHQNRFPYFALRCIDELNLLPQIRFQISLGRVELRSYPKKVGSVEINRRILKDVNVFGKLSAFENRDEWCADKLNVGGVEGLVFDQFYPHYNIKDNKIAFYLLHDKEDTDYLFPSIEKGNIKNPKPSGFLSIAELTKLTFVALESPNKATKAINDFLIKNESFILNINALTKVKAKLNQDVFSRRVVNSKKITRKGRVIYLNDKKEKQLFKKYKISINDFDDLSKVSYVIDNIKQGADKEYIKQIIYKHHLNKRTAFLDEYLATQGITASQLPKQVQNYLLNITDTNGDQVLKVRIKAVIAETNFKKRQLSNHFKGNELTSRIKLGEVATFLARDIIDMLLEKNLKTKITTPFYKQLQHGLAYFSVSKETIIHILESLNIFMYGGHPFLTRDMIHKSEGLLDLYGRYLDFKLRWISKLLPSKREAFSSIELASKLPFTLYSLWEKKSNSSFGKWLEGKKKMPVDLPRGIFDQGALNILYQKLSRQGQSYQTTDKFSVLLAQSCDNDTQPFYNFKRFYKVDDEDVPFFPEKRSSKAIKFGYGKYAEANEKTIRFLQTQDRICKLLCERIIESLGNLASQLHVNLQNMMPFQNTNILNSPFSFKQKIPIQKGKGVNNVYIIAEDNDQQRQSVSFYESLISVEQREAYEGQKGYEWTVKDFGKFKKFIHDRRLPNIADYIDSENLFYPLLEYQLSQYDLYREKVFKATFELEKHLADNYLHHIVEIEKSRDRRFSSVQFKSYLHLLKNLDCFKKQTDANIELLRNIRNKFSHSEFPKFEESYGKISEQMMMDFVNSKIFKTEKSMISLSISYSLYSKYFNLIKSIVE